MSDTVSPKILFDEVGLAPGTSFQKGQWRNIATHSDKAICGFFGDYRFLSNFWPAKVFLDGVEYSCSENAYQASKFDANARTFFQTCTPYEAIKYVKEHFETSNIWEVRKLRRMKILLNQKFDPDINPLLFQMLQSTENKYLEESNYWEDKFWGVHKTSQEDPGVGENNLGKSDGDTR